MRIRPLIALSAVALTGVLLAGCSGGDGGSPSASPSGTASADLCASAAATGAATEAVTVKGDVGSDPSVTFTTPLEITEVERTVETEGSGDPIKNGDWVEYGLSAFDAETGDKVGSVGYQEGSALPIQVSAESLGQLFGCATVGSRIVLGGPGSENGAAQINVLDVLGILPLKAWGEEQEPVAGMPKVTIADNGQPEVTIPDSKAPDELKIAVLKKGDGPVITSTDRSMIQYWGVDWSDGKSFDSTWSRGAEPYVPEQGDNTGYVKGFTQALEGQTVGSQVLVVIPPSLGYGEKGTSDHALAGKTLVFVIDILATQHAATE